ncbi:MAG TPA: N-acetylneuraminate synthase family protein, partial [Anaerolineales bacterium]|nr:N-acetylneuraminate synthase family protein [Anaerolineales bacterium]
MARELRVGNRLIGDGHPAYVIAEIGINHNGDLNIAKRMIDAAVHAGADAVKFQKRTPNVATPPDQQQQMRETPWGYITYLEYRYKVEFNEEQYGEIDAYCRQRNIPWLVSV